MQTTVGAYLQSIRKAKDLTLDQVSQATKVRIPYLQALEDDEINLLPSKVQGRGYLRLYADFLDIPVQPLLAVWPDQPLIFPEPEQEPTQQPEENVAMEGSEEGNPELFPDTGPSLAEERTAAVESVSSEPDSGAAIPPPEAHLAHTPPEYTPISEYDVIPENGSNPVVEPEQLTSQQIFLQIGEQLRTQREKLNVSVEDVERFTRLRVRYIHALEDGRLEDLPSLVQGRGMLSNYADFLNLDTEALLNQFANALQTRRIELLAPAKPVKENKNKQGVRKPVQMPGWRKILTPDLAVGGGLFVLLVVFIVWGSARFTGSPNEDTEPTAPSISEALINPDETAVSEADLLLTSLPSVEVTAGANPSGDIVTGEDLITPEVTETMEGDEAVASNLPVQLVIVVNQRVWMRVIVDDKVAFEGRAIPGNAYPYDAESRIELTAANAAAIELIYNQRNLGELGSIGEVVRLIFTDTETLVPTPMFTGTPTATQQPTYTLQPTQTLAVTLTPAALPSVTITPLVP